MSVRVRFAPSPTGYLHIGGARTALFNWLFARRSGGTFILRIEDTDVERSSAEMVEGILRGLEWLGLTWDEGPYFQSQRLELYRSTAAQLLAQGRAYPCLCSPGQTGECRCRPTDPQPVPPPQGQPHALRFWVPRQETVRFEDVVFGEVEVSGENIEDFVILRTDGMPTYHLSVVADDIDMGITHVIRGADHLSNTGKHVLLYQALKREIPRLVHLPLILGPDKKRLSKRHGATSVMEYKSLGFLPAAVRNYLALLGWSPGTDQEIFTPDELFALFQLSRVNKANAVFDIQKLEWMNGQYVNAASPAELEPLVRPLLEEAGLDAGESEESRQRLLGALALLKSRVRRLTEFAEAGRFFFTGDFEYEPDAVAKYWSPESVHLVVPALRELQDAYRDLEPFGLQDAETALRGVVERHELKAGRLIGAVRLALTGRSAAPGIFDVVVTLGRQETIQRLDRLIATLG